MLTCRCRLLHVLELVIVLIITSIVLIEFATAPTVLQYWRLLPSR